MGAPLNPPDFTIVQMSLWWSDRPLSKVLDNWNKYFLLINIKSIQLGAWDW